MAIRPKIDIDVSAQDNASEILNKVKEAVDSLNLSAQKVNFGNVGQVRDIDAIKSMLGQINQTTTKNAQQTASLTTSFHGLNQAIGAVKASTIDTFSGLGGLIDPFKSSLGSLTTVVQQLQGAFASMGGVLGTLAAALPVVAALGVASSYLTTSLAGASQETQNFIQMQAMWTSTARGSESAMNKMIEQVKDLSRTSTYASQDVVGAMKFLLQYKNISSEMMVPTLKTAIDLASFAGRSVQEAAYAMGMAANQQFEVLRYWGVNISAAAKASGDFSRIVGEINAKVGGQEAAKMETYAGAVGALEKAWNRVQKAVGHTIEAALVPVIKDLVGWFSNLGKGIEEAFQAGQFQPFIDNLKSGFELISASLKGVIEDIISFIKTADMNQIVTQMMTAAAAVSDVAAVFGKLMAAIITMPNWLKAAIAGFIAFKIVFAAVSFVIGSVKKGFTDLATIVERVTGVSLAHGKQLGAETIATKELTAAIREQTVAYQQMSAARSQSGVGTAPGPVGVAGASAKKSSENINNVAKTSGSKIVTGIGSYIGTALKGVLAIGIGTAIGGALDSAGSSPGVVAAGSIIGTTVGYGILEGVAKFVLPKIGQVLLGAFAGVSVGIIAAIMAPLAIAAAGIGGLYLLKKKLDKDYAEDQKRDALKEMGLTKMTGSEVAKQTLATSKAVKEFGSDSGSGLEAINKMAEAYARVGKSVKEFGDDYTKYVGGKVPESAKKMFEATQDAIKNADIEQVRNRSLIDSYDTLVKIKMATGKSLSQVEKEMRDEITKSTTMTKDDRENALYGLTKAVSQISKERDRIQAEIDKGVDWSKFSPATAEEDTRPLEERLKDLKAFYKEQEMLEKANTETLKTEAVKQSNSKYEAEQKILQVMQQSRARQVAQIQEQFDLTTRENQKERDRSIENAKQDEEQKVAAIKKYHEAEIALTQETEQKLLQIRQQTEQEIQKLLQDRMALEQRVNQERFDSQKAFDSVVAKSEGPIRRLGMSYQQAMEEMKRAFDLVTTDPEKAIQFATKARSAFQSLAQDIYALRNNLIDSGIFLEKLQTQMDKKYASPIEAWNMDLKEVEKTIARAQEAKSAGDLAKAEQLAKDAASKSQQLYQGAAGKENEEAAKAIFKEAAYLVQDVASGRLIQAEEMNRKVVASMDKASQIIDQGLNKLLADNNVKLGTLRESLEKLNGTLQEVNSKKEGLLVPKEAGGGTGAEAQRGYSPTGETGTAGVTESDAERIKRENTVAAAQAEVIRQQREEARNAFGGGQTPAGKSTAQQIKDFFKDAVTTFVSPGGFKGMDQNAIPSDFVSTNERISTGLEQLVDKLDPVKMAEAFMQASAGGIDGQTVTPSGQAKSPATIMSEENDKLRQMAKELREGKIQVSVDVRSEPGTFVEVNGGGTGNFDGFR